MNSEGSILLIGAGKMGTAMLKGWIAQGIDPQNILVVEKYPSPQLLQCGVNIMPTLPEKGGGALPQVIVLAVKPQQMQGVLEECVPLAKAGALCISIAAGKTTAFFEQHLGQDCAIIRAMPNLPATIGEGASVLYATAVVTREQRAVAGKLFAAIGQYVYVEEESLIDAVTALSGSGPAYVFLLAEAMAEAAIKLGLPAAIAESLTRQTLLGSVQLLSQAPEPAGLLREHVTSPGGTTEAALRILMQEESGIKPLMLQAMQAACERSHELAD